MLRRRTSYSLVPRSDSGTDGLRQRIVRGPGHRTFHGTLSYEWRPRSFLGRLLVFVLAVLTAVALFFLSLVLFFLIAAAVLFSMAFVWWRSWRARALKTKP